MKILSTKLCALTFIVALATPSLIAQDRKNPACQEYTRAQIKRLAREANSSEQYTRIADYYARQQSMYQAKVVEMMHLWRQRNEMYYRVEKWPRPIDSARNLHDYYEYKANEAAKLQSQYRRQADEAAGSQRPNTH